MKTKKNTKSATACGNSRQYNGVVMNEISDGSIQEEERTEILCYFTDNSDNVIAVNLILIIWELLLFVKTILENNKILLMPVLRLIAQGLIVQVLAIHIGVIARRQWAIILNICWMTIVMLLELSGGFRNHDSFAILCLVVLYGSVVYPHIMFLHERNDSAPERRKDTHSCCQITQEEIDASEA